MIWTNEYVSLKISKSILSNCNHNTQFTILNILKEIRILMKLSQDGKSKQNGCLEMKDYCL